MHSRRRRRSTGIDRSYQLDCTQKCQLPLHASLVLSCVSLGNLELIKHCSTVCANCWGVRDCFGRTALHVAASCGHLHVVDWLVAKRKVRLDEKDGESKWTALHRSTYFGRAGVCVYLSKNGANLNMLDCARCSSLNLLQMNSQLLDPQPLVSSVCLFTWGRNANFTLGHNLSRDVPERLEIDPPMGNIIQVIVHKFHCVFLSQTGLVYTCGHGRGGRLGHGNENAVQSPKLVVWLKKEKCTAVAASRDHTVFLTKSGSVYTCGLNDGHQLGFGGKQVPILTPTLIRSLKNREVISVGAGRYHTAVVTSKELLSFGKNLGQLGHDSTVEAQIQPRVVSAIHIDSSDSIMHLSVSDATTACITKRHHIFVCSGYRVLRCERWAPSTLSVRQFCVSANLGELAHKKKKRCTHTHQQSLPLQQEREVGGGGNGIIVLVLDSTGQLWSSGWTDALRKTCLPPQPVAGSSWYKVIHFFLGKSLSLVTKHGEVYTGLVSAPDDLSLLNLNRVPLVQSARSIFTDYKALNFAMVQNVYSPPDLPEVEPSSFTTDIYELYTEACLPGSLSDVTLVVCHESFNTNKLVLASRSSLFEMIFSSQCLPHNFPSLIQSVIFNSENTVITIDFSSSKLFDLFLHLLYGGQVVIKSDELTPPYSPLPSPSRKSQGHTTESTPNTSFNSGDDVDWTAMYDRFGGGQSAISDLCVSLNGSQSPISVSFSASPDRSDRGVGKREDKEDVLVKVWKTTKWRSDVHSLLQLAHDLQVNDLKEKLEGVLSAGKAGSYITVSGRRLILNVKHSPVPHDVVLVSEEGEEIECHKCILVARSDYFQSMLMMGWRESNTSDKVTKLKQPISAPILKLVVDYLYTDQRPQITDTSSIDLLTSGLIVADQLLLNRLKSMCELLLAKRLTLRNAADLAEFAMAYNSPQLRRSALQYICVNLPALLEGRLLDSLTLSTLTELTQTYSDLFPEVANRKIKFSELTTDQLPQSYLCNETLEFSEDEEEEEDADTDSTLALDSSYSSVGGRGKGEETPTRARSPLQESTPIRASSGSGSNAVRRRRRRKTSVNRQQSDCSFSSPPTSPDPNLEELSSSKTRLVFSLASPEAVSYPRLTEPYSPECLEDVSKDAERVCERKESLSEREKENRLFEKRSNERQLKKNPWIVVGKSTSTLKSIIAEEQQQQQEHQQKTANVQHRKGGSEVRSGECSKSSGAGNCSNRKLSSPKEVEKGREKNKVGGSALSHTHQSTRNPWKVDQVSSPPQVSLLELIAEEEKEEVKRKEREFAQRPRMNEMCVRERTPVSPPIIQQYPVVSFADIVSSQQKEMEEHMQRVPRKSLALIQIEERAIEGLLQQYSAIDNPDEYITVARCPRSSGRRKKLNFSSQDVSTSSPWSLSHVK